MIKTCVNSVQGKVAIKIWSLHGVAMEEVLGPPPNFCSFHNDRLECGHALIDSQKASSPGATGLPTF